jgi:hypothetical protein
MNKKELILRKQQLEKKLYNLRNKASFIRPSYSGIVGQVSYNISFKDNSYAIEGVLAELDDVKLQLSMIFRNEKKGN